jgi:alkylhydroperoxidase/carboxymuconolactone decarboxylase family protein YurZ
MYDMKNLSKLKNLEANAPEAMKAFVAFDKAALAEGAIPVKYKELMALAVAETVLIAAALRAGAAITHGTHAMKGT